MAVAEELVSEAERYAGEWGEIAPRPEDVGRDVSGSGGGEP